MTASEITSSAILLCRWQIAVFISNVVSKFFTVFFYDMIVEIKKLPAYLHKSFPVTVSQNQNDQYSDASPSSIYIYTPRRQHTEQNFVDESFVTCQRRERVTDDFCLRFV